MENSQLSSSAYRWDAGLLLSDRASHHETVSLGLLLGGLCVGLPAIALVLLSFCCKCAEPRNLTVFSVSLVFVALLQSLSTPVVAMELMGSYCSLRYCGKLMAVWFASRHCGVLLHLLAALEFALSRKRLSAGGKIRSVYWSLPVVLTLFLISILFFEVTEAVVALGVLAMTTVLMICGTACNRPKVIALALSTAATYCPSFVVGCMILNQDFVSGSLNNIFLCLTNLRLITDGILCWVISREPFQERPQKTDIGLDNRGLEP